MKKKNPECASYAINGIRNAYKDFNQIDEEIRAKIINTAKGLIDGKDFDISDFAGSFRVRECVENRFNDAVDSYIRHQDRCHCTIPEDILEIF